MAKFWDKLVFEFCKVEFLCWHGDPHWLGWIVMIGGFVLFFIVVFVVIVVIAAFASD